MYEEVTYTIKNRNPDIDDKEMKILRDTDNGKFVCWKPFTADHKFCGYYYQDYISINSINNKLKNSDILIEVGEKPKKEFIKSFLDVRQYEYNEACKNGKNISRLVGRRQLKSVSQKRLDIMRNLLKEEKRIKHEKDAQKVIEETDKLEELYNRLERDETIQAYRKQECKWHSKPVFTSVLAAFFSGLVGFFAGSLIVIAITVVAIGVLFYCVDRYF